MIGRIPITVHAVVFPLLHSVYPCTVLSSVPSAFAPSPGHGTATDTALNIMIPTMIPTAADMKARMNVMLIIEWSDQKRLFKEKFFAVLRVKFQESFPLERPLHQ